MMRKQAANTATKHTLKTLSLTLVIVEVTERVENVRYKGERKWSIPRVRGRGGMRDAWGQMRGSGQQQPAVGPQSSFRDCFRARSLYSNYPGKTENKRAQSKFVDMASGRFRVTGSAIVVF